MRFDINQFRTDPDKKSQGVWIDFGGGARFKIASFDNQDFANEFRQMLQPYQKLGQEIPRGEQTRILVHCMARHIVLDWEGVFDGDEELPYSEENAKRLLSEIEFVLDRIIEEAKRLENFRKEKAEEIEGN